MSAYSCESNFEISGENLKAKQTASLRIYKQALIFAEKIFFLCLKETKS